MKRKPTPASFKPGDPRASLAGKKSSRALSDEARFIRAQTASDIEKCVHTYMYKDLPELKDIFAKGDLPYMDMIIISTLIKGFEIGDFGHIESVLARSIGRVAERINVTSTHASYKEIRIKLEEMDDEQATQKYFELLKEGK